TWIDEGKISGPKIHGPYMEGKGNFRLQVHELSGPEDARKTAEFWADLVVVRGDPSVKISDVENVEVVFKDGVGYDSARLMESVRGLVGLR
ncbi:MAG TPA: hypothetical protein VEI01_18175, partial [Terriglobales bacterium]|nr:hypothetical protein [Terriglobales bacterium]